MDQDRSTSAEQGGMQFDQADLGSEGPRSFECAFCRTPLHSSYFQINGQPSCEACRYKVDAELAVRPGLRSFLKALAAGIGAAAVGAGIYYAVLALSGYEVGLVAILVGYMVGRAVRWGTNGRGGRGYQFLAVGLTYLAIVSTYIPLMIEEIVKNPPALEQPAVAAAGAEQAADKSGAPEGEEIGVGGMFLALGLLVLMAAALPFLAGIENILGLVIIAVGLWEAWRHNRRLTLDVSGPFEIGRLAAPQPAPGSAA
jgi:hypothetical protein